MKPMTQRFLDFDWVCYSLPLFARLRPCLNTAAKCGDPCQRVTKFALHLIVHCARSAVTVPVPLSNNLLGSTPPPPRAALYQMPFVP